MKIFRQITANNIQLRDYPFLKELAMEAYLLENGDVLKLDDDNFSDVEILDAEIALRQGRKTSNRDGRIDILAKYGLDYLSIIELKTEEINEQTLAQLEDYLNQRDQILEKYPEYWEDENPPNWIGVLVGSSISPELQRLLLDGYKTEDQIPIAALVVRRYRAENRDVYVVTDTYFKYHYSKRDYSKFKFRNQEYNKPRLVNAVIRTYLSENPNTTYSELEKIFPPKLQKGVTGVFTTKEKANEVFDRTGYKRYYIKSEEYIELADCTISTTTQWGRDNIKYFIEYVNKNLPDYTIEIE